MACYSNTEKIAYTQNIFTRRNSRAILVVNANLKKISLNFRLLNKPLKDYIVGMKVRYVVYILSYFIKLMKNRRKGALSLLS